MAIAFYILGTVLVLAGLRVVTSRNLVHAAVFLVLSFLSLAGLYLLLGAEFLAAVQVLVYAGGIMVLFLYAVMLVSFRRVQQMPAYHPKQGLAGAALAGAVFLVLFLVFVASPFEPRSVRPDEAFVASGGDLARVADALFGPYVFAFELLAVFLLAAMVGAILLARKEV